MDICEGVRRARLVLLVLVAFPPLVPLAVVVFWFPLPTLLMDPASCSAVSSVGAEPEPVSALGIRPLRRLMTASRRLQRVTTIRTTRKPQIAAAGT